MCLSIGVLSAYNVDTCVCSVCVLLLLCSPATYCFQPGVRMMWCRSVSCLLHRHRHHGSCRRHLTLSCRLFSISIFHVEQPPPACYPAIKPTWPTERPTECILTCTIWFQSTIEFCVVKSKSYYTCCLLLLLILHYHKFEKELKELKFLPLNGLSKFSDRK